MSVIDACLISPALLFLGVGTGNVNSAIAQIIETQEEEEVINKNKSIISSKKLSECNLPKC